MHAQDEPARLQKIRERAYLMWLDSGQPEGHSDEHWHAACRAVDTDADDQHIEAIAHEAATDAPFHPKVS